MRRALLLSSLAAVVALGLTVVANEKPTADFQNLMRSNGAAFGPMGLRGHIPAKDYDGIAKDAATIKGNMSKVEAFFVSKKMDDAANLAKNGGKAAGDIEAAAMKKDDAAIASANMALGGACGGCHMAHRQQLEDKSFEIK